VGVLAALAVALVRKPWAWLVRHVFLGLFARLTRCGPPPREDDDDAVRSELAITRALLEVGAVVSTTEGTPQGGPLSPLLSNIVLDERRVSYGTCCVLPAPPQGSTPPGDAR
jgi:hypothetical protein